MNETENETEFAKIPDSRPFQYTLASNLPPVGILAAVQMQREGRSHPAIISPPLFAYYLANYLAACRHLRRLLRETAEPMEILSIGSGTGWGEAWLAEQLPQARVIATNKVEGRGDRVALEYVRKIDLDRLSAEEADATDLSKYPDESFHAVIMLEVIEHIDPRKHHEVFKEISRVLKPGGIAIISTPAGEGYGQTESGPQNAEHVWIFGNRQDLIRSAASHFQRTEVNRIVNPVHTRTFRGPTRTTLLKFGLFKSSRRIIWKLQICKGIRIHRPRAQKSTRHLRLDLSSEKVKT